jgi:hypothetical protein
VALAHWPPLVAFPLTESVKFPVVRFPEAELEELPEPQVEFTLEITRVAPEKGAVTVSWGLDADATGFTMITTTKIAAAASRRGSGRKRP